MKSYRALSCVNVELVSDVSEAVSVPIMRGGDVAVSLYQSSVEHSSP